MHRPRSIHRISALAGLVGALLAATDSNAAVDRRILGVGITPASAAGHHDLWVSYTIAATPTSAPTNASMLIQLFRNDEPVPAATKLVSVQINGGSGFCGGGSCGPNCGSGTIDGVFNTMLCLPDPVACPGANCDCECRFPSITAELPSVELEPGDEITVILVPATGSAPEPAGDTNSKYDTSFDGTPHFWQRRATSVEVLPASSGRPGLVDLAVKGDVIWHGLSKPSSLGIEVHVVGHAGVVLDSKFVDGAMSPNADPLACGGLGCGGLCGVWNGQQVDCFAFPNIWFLPCTCGGGWLLMFYDLDPSDLPGATIVLSAPEAALPELPGLESDAIVLCPASDLTGDCHVDGDDLGTLLGLWGPCPAPCPADLNSDGVVNGEDLGTMLGDWG